MGRTIDMHSKNEDGRRLYLRITPAQLRFLGAQRRTKARVRDGKPMREPIGEVLRRIVDEAAERLRAAA